MMKHKWFILAALVVLLSYCHFDEDRKLKEYAIKEDNFMRLIGKE